MLSVARIISLSFEVAISSEPGVTETKYSVSPVASDGVEVNTPGGWKLELFSSIKVMVRVDFDVSVNKGRNETELDIVIFEGSVVDSSELMGKEAAVTSDFEMEPVVVSCDDVITFGITVLNIDDTSVNRSPEPSDCVSGFADVIETVSSVLVIVSGKAESICSFVAKTSVVDSVV